MHNFEKLRGKQRDAGPHRFHVKCVGNGHSKPNPRAARKPPSMFSSPAPAAGLAAPAAIAAFLLFSFFHSAVAAPPKFLWTDCSKTNNYTKGDDFAGNLALLFPSLVSTANKSGFSGNFFFANDSAGNSVSRVFGLTMCFADSNDADCQNCLSFAGSDIVAQCPNSTKAAIWYDACFLRYSDTNFFTVVAPKPVFYLQNAANVSQPDKQKKVLTALYDSLIANASASPKRYAQSSANYTSDGDQVFAEVQCTPDISGSDCAASLKNFTPSMPTSPFGARLFGLNAYMRYEANAFHVPSPPPPPPPPLSGSPPTDRNGTSSGQASSSSSSSTVVIVVVVVLVVAFLAAAIGFCLWRRKRKSQSTKDRDSEVLFASSKHIFEEGQTIAFLMFDFNTLRNATNDFSDENKLGQGGFGPVYKGTLASGKEIAVKRLAGGSSQGLTELKNEVDLLVKLQHKNLVRLLGYCIQDKENILCYEFLSNGSLDRILFTKDTAKREELNWEKRFKIIEGICRGLLYLHEESQITIVHRDLKASNILLDKDMTPKISDFGLARLFTVDQTHKDTSIIAGTFGYMAPEYVLHGTFSIKSDVYSLGVLLLEIVTGRRCGALTDSSGQSTNLLGFAWKHYMGGEAIKLIDSALGDESFDQMTKCLHIALLCVQENPTLRPTMDQVNMMLNSDSATFPALRPSWSMWSDVGGSSEQGYSISYKSSQSASDTSKGFPLSDKL